MSTGPNITLTTEQVELHRQHLASLTDFRVFPVLTETILYAIFTMLIITSSYILLTRGLDTRSAKIMLATTLILYGLSTWDWAIDIVFLRDDLKVFLPADLIQPSPDHHRRIEVNTALRISQSITNNISTMLSDSVVVWRVYVVYGRNKRVLAMGIALLVALFSGLLLCNLTQIGLGFPGVKHLHILAPAELIIDIVTLIMSALVNIWATAMIGYQAWRYRREIKYYLKDTTTQSFAESMLVLFTETGVVYTSLWILKNIIVIPEVVKTPYTTYANLVMYQITGMYPTIIIILVALRKSHLETQFTSYGPSIATQGMVFESSSYSSSSSSSGPTTSTARQQQPQRIQQRSRHVTDVLVSMEIKHPEGEESRSDLESGDGKGLS